VTRKDKETWVNLPGTSKSLSLLKKKASKKMKKRIQSEKKYLGGEEEGRRSKKWVLYCVQNKKRTEKNKSGPESCPKKKRGYILGGRGQKRKTWKKKNREGPDVPLSEHKRYTRRKRAERLQSQRTRLHRLDGTRIRITRRRPYAWRNRAGSTNHFAPKKPCGGGGAKVRKCMQGRKRSMCQSNSRKYDQDSKEKTR